MLYTPRAARELEQAAARIAEDNPAAADAFLQSALSAAVRLASRPGLGRSRPYVPPRYRFWSLLRHNYLLVYDASVEPIQIVRVVHMARDLPRLLAGMPDRPHTPAPAGPHRIGGATVGNARSTKGNPAPLRSELEAQIRALEAMPDSTIDLTGPDAPEILDWSGSVRGRFHRLVERRITSHPTADVPDWPERNASGGGRQTNTNSARGST